MKSNFIKKSKMVADIIDMQDNHVFVDNHGTRTYPYDFIIAKLDIESQRILYFDYIKKKSKNWYLGYYSKSTYYRLKNNALDEFLELVIRH